MTGRFLHAPRAQMDEDDIWNYTAERRGDHQPDIYVHQLGASLAMLAANPALGRAVPEVHAD